MKSCPNYLLFSFPFMITEKFHGLISNILFTIKKNSLLELLILISPDCIYKKNYIQILKKRDIGKFKKQAFMKDDCTFVYSS